MGAVRATAPGLDMMQDKRGQTRDEPSPGPVAHRPAAATSLAGEAGPGGTLGGVSDRPPRIDQDVSVPLNEWSGLIWSTDDVVPGQGPRLLGQCLLVTGLEWKVWPCEQRRATRRKDKTRLQISNRLVE
jgi:hypothetical protein